MSVPVGRSPTTLARYPARFRDALERLRREDDEGRFQVYVLNNFTGRPRIEEDSPGNYVVRSGPHGVEYLWYDQDGGEHVVDLAERMHLETDKQPETVPDN